MCTSISAHIHPLMNMISVTENWLGYQRSMFTVGPVHTRNHGQGCSGAEPDHAARQMGEGEGSYYMPLQGGGIAININK